MWQNKKPMKIDRLIEALHKFKREGYKYVSINNYGFSKTSFELGISKLEFHDDKPMFITIYNWDLLRKKPKKVIEGKHFDVIEVKIISIDNRLKYQVFETNYELYATVKEVKPLPAWYDKDYYYDDFEEIGLDEIDFVNDYFCTAELIDILELDRDDFEIEFKNSVEG